MHLRSIQGKGNEMNTSTGQGATLAVTFSRLERFGLGTMLFNAAVVAGAIVKHDVGIGIPAMVLFVVGQILFCWER
jgi:hypothetical protein